jgi:phosphoribosylanthranilate isomerase
VGLVACHAARALVLSGGLTPDNVAEGIAATDPWAVDTASGTEAEPGVKDPDRLRAFFAAAGSAVAAP